MSNAIYNAVVALILALLMVGITALFLYSAGYRLKPKNIKLPFFELDISSFEQLSAVRLFVSVSRAIINPSVSANRLLDGGRIPDITPQLLVHVGWQIVSDAFCREFIEYPSEDNVFSKSAKIGSQNCEFINLYRKIYEIAFRHQEDLKKDFAIQYFLRAPSLAARISSNVELTDDELFQTIAAFLPHDG